MLTRDSTRHRDGSAQVAVVTILCAVLAAVGCQTRPHQAMPAIHIDVEIHGETVAPIDAATLRALAPDYSSDGRRAWILRNLFPGVLVPGVSLEASGGQGARAVHDRPGADFEGRTLALVVDAGGVPIIARIDPTAPLANADGGGVAHVRRVRIFRPGDEARAPLQKDAPPTATLEVIVDKDAPVVWSYETLAGVPRADGAPKGRDVWSLRQLVHALVGPETRVLYLRNKAGKAANLTREDWDDPARVPMIKLNRRGELKAWWANAASPGPGPTLLDGVQTIHATRAR